MSVTTPGTARDFGAKLDHLEPAIRAALPEHVPFDRFRRIVLTAVQADADLLRADARLLLTACLRAAQDGLMPDKREGVIMLFKGKPAWMPMVAGLMKLARNSGEIVSMQAQVVYRGEPFRVALGDEDRIMHERVLDAVDAGQPPIAVYAIALLRDGTRMHEAMTWKQVMKVKGSSASGDKGPWGAWPDEMARKTVLRRLLKRLPLSTDRDGDKRLVRAVERVDEDHPKLAGHAAAAGLLADEAGGRLDGFEQQLAEPDAAEAAPAFANATDDELAGLP
ncbi:MAG: recombinase RecT [Acetobacteraceae bacterium]|nr:recombinase RecT [Acetobacteraceae bacterium]